MSSAGTVVAILASTVIILGGIATLIRAVWRMAQTFRDNTQATNTLSGKIDKLEKVMDGRIIGLEKRVDDLERAMATLTP